MTRSGQPPMPNGFCFYALSLSLSLHPVLPLCPFLPSPPHSLSTILSSPDVQKNSSSPSHDHYPSSSNSDSHLDFPSDSEDEELGEKDFDVAERMRTQGEIQVYESIPQPDLICQTAMVSACNKLGDVGFARELFDSMAQRDSIVWSAMIAGYAQCGESKEALHLFNLMQLEGVKVNEVSMVSFLSACGQLGASDHGRWAHAYIERNKIHVTLGTATLGTALVDMYAKCGDMNKGMEVFWGMKERNVYTWSSAMNGLAINGAADKCLELFSLMKHDGVLPNEVTFLSILKACCAAGIVEEGRKYFDSMRTEYALEPSVEHYGCMVDLYGRAGCLDEALNIINSMPMMPHAGAWGALLISKACNSAKYHK